MQFAHNPVTNWHSQLQSTKLIQKTSETSYMIATHLAMLFARLAIQHFGIATSPIIASNPYLTALHVLDTFYIYEAVGEDPM